MSGGAFDYAQYRIADIYTEIEDEIYGHSLDDEFVLDWYLRSGYKLFDKKSNLLIKKLED